MGQPIWDTYIGAESQHSYMFVNLSPDCFLKVISKRSTKLSLQFSYFLNHRLDLLSKYFIYFAITHSSCHLKTPFLVSLSLILHSEILFIISINPIIAEKDTPAVATNLERKKIKRQFHQFTTLPFLNLSR